MITTNVAHSLCKCCGDDSVIVEGNSTDTLKEAGRKVGRQSNKTKNKRYDIVLYFPTNNKPRAVIEIKNQARIGGIMTDVKRVFAALKGSELKFGVIGYCFSNLDGKQKTATEKLSDYAERLEQQAKEEAARKFKVTSEVKIRVVGNDAWIAGCIVVEQ